MSICLSGMVQKIKTVESLTQTLSGAKEAVNDSKERAVDGYVDAMIQNTKAMVNGVEPALSVKGSYVPKAFKSEIKFFGGAHPESSTESSPLSSVKNGMLKLLAVKSLDGAARSSRMSGIMFIEGQDRPDESISRI